MANKTRIFFVTDVHGSDRCFRKFLNAAKIYSANVLILGGDITGKMIIPIVEQNGGTFKCNLTGTDVTLKSKEEVESMAKTIRDSGYYPYYTHPSEVEEMNAKPEYVTQLFAKLMVEGIQGWVKLAEERLKGLGVSCCISPGNDDILAIDDALNSSSYVINPEEKVVAIDRDHEMITLGTVNHTPWNSPREVDEDVLAKKIEAMTDNVKDVKRAVFNIHVPPISTPIDQAPKLDSTLKPVVSGGRIVMISAGSVATRQAIEKYQPLMGIHGHIHESKGLVRIGRTMSFNPGSEYGEGILRGLLCELESDKIKSFMFTSG